MFYVITVVWNDLTGLKKTFESVDSQDLNDFNWLVIDGNSIDGTKEWLEQLKFEKLTYVSEPDYGIYDAMNKGIAMLADKEYGYFIFMNAGDEFAHPEVLNNVNKLAKENMAMLLGSYVDVANYEYHKNPKPISHISKGMLTSHQATFFSVSHCKGVFHNLKYKLSADYDYVARVSLADNQVQLVDETICKFYLDGVSVKRRLGALKEDFHIRITTLKMNRVKATSLYALHLLHYLLKRLAPNFFNSKRL